MNPQEAMLILRRGLYFEGLVCEPDRYTYHKADLHLTEDVVKLLCRVLLWKPRHSGRQNSGAWWAFLKA